MTTYIGLYYPFIHFKDDSWVKLAALYWDRMGRIVPKDYKTHDSDTVRQLIDELGFIDNFAPGEETMSVGKRFVAVLEQHRDKLRDRYGIAQRDNWPDDPITLTAAPPGSDPKLAYVFAEKIWGDLGWTLEHLGLARYGQGDDPRWLGLHPRLADVYMAVLAAEMASSRGLHPVTDETINHVAVSGYSIERITQALLGDVVLAAEQPADNEIEIRLAALALQSVLPKDIANVPTKKIIELRKQHSDELTEFQNYIHGLADGLSVVKDPSALKTHLDVEYEKNLKPKINNLKKSLQALDISTVLGAMNLEIKMSGALAGIILAPLSPILAAAGAFALTVLPVIGEKRKAYEEKLRSSPVAYLLHLEEELQPATLTSWVSQRARKFLYGV